jgi:hypothetical protein
MRQHAFLLAGLLAVATGPSTCSAPQQFHTVVHDDGSVDRAIVQDVDLTPESARHPQLWLESRLATAGPEDPWDGSIAALPTPTGDAHAKFFAARGHFATVAAVPDHYAEAAKDGIATSRLSRALTTRDLGLVTERVWTETLSDIVSPGDTEKAREELSQINVKLLQAALDQGLGRDYDYQAYVDWVGKTSKDLFAMFAELGLESRAANVPGVWSDDSTPLGQEVVARYNMPWLTGDDGNDKMKAFVQERTRSLIKRRDGRPVDTATVDLIVEAVWNIGENALISFDKEGGGAPFEAGIDRVVASDYGGAEALNKRAEILYQRTLGITFWNSGRAYAFDLTIPGAIVETNGTLEGDSRVAWDFKLGDAFAFGYTMRCRTLEPNAAAARAVLGAARLTSREAMLRYVALVDGDEELIKVVRQSIQERQAAPLRAYQATLAADPKQTDRTAKVAKLMTLLGLATK